jgi:hypothetical protein
MNIFNQIKSFEFDRNKSHKYGIKSGIIWAYSNQSNCCYPMLYISKPKGISQEDFELLLDSIDINFRIKP